VTSDSLLEILAQRVTCAQFTALLLHELGHLRHGDTRFGLGIGWLAAPWRLTLGAGWRLFVGTGRLRSRALVVMVAVIAAGLAAGQAVERGQWSTAILLGVLVVCSSVVPLLDAHVARSREYAADRFAADCGYGEALIEVLVLASSGVERAGLARRHPPTHKRCARILAISRLNPSDHRVSLWR
jgi:Zn-dependent protease with chaperone function